LVFLDWFCKKGPKTGQLTFPNYELYGNASLQVNILAASSEQGIVMFVGRFKTINSSAANTLRTALSICLNANAALDVAIYTL